MSEKQGQRTTNWLVPAALILIAALLAVLVILQLRGNDQPAAQTPPGDAAELGNIPERIPELAQLERRDEADVHSAGSVDAPLTMIVYSDYQCPFCARWNHETLPAMMEHVDEGSLRIEWRDINMYGDASERASLAAHAAGLQGKYWEYHNALFANGESRDESSLSADALIELAADLELDTEQFAADMESEELLAQNQQNAAEGRGIGVTGTPTFVLDARPIVGAQPTEVFSRVIETALAEQE